MIIVSRMHLSLKRDFQRVMVNLFLTSARQDSWVLGHSQVVADETHTEAEFSHQLCDGLSGFLE